MVSTDFSENGIFVDDTQSDALIMSINNNNSNYNIVIVLIKKIFFLPSFFFPFFSGIKENCPFKTFKIVLLGQFDFRVLFKN